MPLLNLVFWLISRELICNSVTEYSYTRGPSTATPGDRVRLTKCRKARLADYLPYTKGVILK